MSKKDAKETPEVEPTEFQTEEPGTPEQDIEKYRCSPDVGGEEPPPEGGEGEGEETLTKAQLKHK